MGLGIALVSAYARFSRDQRRRLWLSRRKRQAADVLRGHTAAGGEHWPRFADRRGVWIRREVPGQVSEGVLHHGLVLWPADRGASDSDGRQLCGGVGEFRRPHIAPQHVAEISVEPDGHGDWR